MRTSIEDISKILIDICKKLDNLDNIKDETKIKELVNWSLFNDKETSVKIGDFKEQLKAQEELSEEARRLAR